MGGCDAATTELRGSKPLLGFRGILAVGRDNGRWATGHPGSGLLVVPLGHICSTLQLALPGENLPTVSHWLSPHIPNPDQARGRGQTVI